METSRIGHENKNSHKMIINNSKNQITLCFGPRLSMENKRLLT